MVVQLWGELDWIKKKINKNQAKPNHHCQKSPPKTQNTLQQQQQQTETKKKPKTHKTPFCPSLDCQEVPNQQQEWEKGLLALPLECSPNSALRVAGFVLH